MLFLVKRIMFPCFIVLHRSILLPVLTLNLLTVLTILGIIINTDFRFWENKKNTKSHRCESQKTREEISQSGNSLNF